MGCVCRRGYEVDTGPRGGHVTERGKKGLSFETDLGSVKDGPWVLKNVGFLLCWSCQRTCDHQGTSSVRGNRQVGKRKDYL